MTDEDVAKRQGAAVKPDTKAIRARADAATAGPWRWRSSPVWSEAEALEKGYVDLRNASEVVVLDEWATYADDGGLEVGPADMVFIAAARTDVPALCDEVERLRRLVSDLARVLQRCCDKAEFDGWHRGEFDHGRAVAAEARAALEGEP